MYVIVTNYGQKERQIPSHYSMVFIPVMFKRTNENTSSYKPRMALLKMACKPQAKRLKSMCTFKRNGKMKKT